MILNNNKNFHFIIQMLQYSGIGINILLFEFEINIPFFKIELNYTASDFIFRNYKIVIEKGEAIRMLSQHQTT